MADEPNKPNRPIRPRQGAPGRKRRVVIEGGTNRPNPRHNRGRTDAMPKREKQEVAPPTGPATVPSGVSVRDLSQALGVPAAQLIKIMMGLGQMVQITQSLSDDEVELIGTELSREITIKHAADEEELPEVFEDAEEDLAPRPPVVTPAALALARYRFRGRGTGDLVILADIAAPSVVVGASLLGLFVYLGVNRGFGTILIAHVAFNVAFVVIVLQARLRDIDPSLSEAARDLGSNPIQAFWLITVPVIFPAILSAALLAAALSIDDFIITSFVAGQTLTFPLWVYGSVKVGIPPQVFAMGTLIFAVGVLIAIAGLVIARRSPKSA